MEDPQNRPYYEAPYPTGVCEKKDTNDDDGDDDGDDDDDDDDGDDDDEDDDDDAKMVRGREKF